MCIKVIGIDPAPSKPSTVYSEEDGFKSFDANKLNGYLDDKKAPVLICWDAPLTGPRNPDAEQMQQGDYSQRDIESFFRSPVNGMKTPKGISVLGYSGCPHWTITRAMLGLPRVGCYDQRENLPFQLLASEEQKVDFLKTQGKGVVEVHPAVALWLWLKDITNIKEEFEKKKWMKKGKNKKEEIMDWTYKYDEKKHDELQRSKIEFFCEKLEGVFLNDKIEKSLSEAIAQMLPQGSKLDDMFDAMLAWLLGKLWVENVQQNNKPVILLGSQATGAMLLPNSDHLITKWNRFNNN